MAEHTSHASHDHARAQITVRGLEVSYGDRSALKGIDLDLRPGELHVLLGSSGAGKTTIVNALTGMLPRTARLGGRIELDHGEAHWNLVGLGPRAFRSRILGRIIGTTIQGSVSAFTATSTIGTQLREAIGAISPRTGLLPVHPHLASSDDQQRLRELCWAAGAEIDWLGRYPHELSGGQLSRLGLVAAMIGHPPVLLADEPTAGLDGESAAGLMNALASFAHSGHAVLLITHEAGLARRFGDLVSVIENGTITAQGDPRELIAPRRVVRRSAAAAPVEPGPGLAARRVTRVLGGQQIVRDLCLEVPRGRIVGLAGPSGVGKSTLASMMALLAAPDAGAIELDGRTLTQAGLRLPPQVRRKVGWVCQQPFTAMDPRMSLAKAIELPARLAGLDVRAEEAAGLCGLPTDVLVRRPDQVSGGELQRACIARALALQPDYLVLDEITAMLDHRTADDVLKQVGAAADEHGIGVLLISHDQLVLDEFADFGWRLEPGNDGPALRRADDNNEIEEYHNASHSR